MVQLLEADQRDLIGLRPDCWGRVQVPPGWEPVAEMCRVIREELTARVSDTVDAIRGEVAIYRLPTVPRDDLERSVACNLEMLLLGIAERRGPTMEELEVRSALGNRRAHQGFPVDALLQAYHVGYRDLWRRFLKYAADHDVSDLLLDAATTMWEWTHRVTDAIGRAHADTSRLLAVRAASSRHRFLELLLTGDTESDEVTTLCRSLGFDARATFRAAVLCGVDGAVVPRLEAELSLLRGVHQAIPHGPRVVVLSQAGENDHELEAAVMRLLPQAVTGLGLPREGLNGARLSVGDAERAAEAAVIAGVHTFERAWMWGVLARERERLEGFLAVGRDVAAASPPLAEAVEAFAASGFSVSAAAHRMHIHPNTATYRLGRWHELTGWDPRAFDGLVRSLAALRLASLERPPGGIRGGQ